MVEPIRVTTSGTYEPEWGNEGRADADKIRVHYRFLTFAEQQELLSPAEIGKSFAYESRVLARMVTRVDNLIVDDGKTRTIKDGQGIVDEPGLDGLAMELWLAFRNMTAVDKKKLPSESDSGLKGNTGKPSAKKSATAKSEQS
jgi:hypothetical protein